MQWRWLTHWRMLALGCKYVFLLGSPTLQLIKALGWPLAVPVRWYPVGQRPTQVMSRVPGTDLMCAVPGISQTFRSCCDRDFPSRSVTDPEPAALGLFVNGFMPHGTSETRVF